MKSRIASPRVATTDCISHPPPSSNTATEIVSRWTSIPTYLTLFIRVFLSLRFGCLLLTEPTAAYSKGAPFYNACPILARSLRKGGIPQLPASWCLILSPTRSLCRCFPHPHCSLNLAKLPAISHNECIAHKHDAPHHQLVKAQDFVPN